MDDSVINTLNEGLAKVVNNEALNTYATNALVNVTSMTPEETEAYYAEQAAIYASYLTDYIEK